MGPRTPSPFSIDRASLLGLPPEVLEQVYQVLDIPDRLRLRRRLRNIYRSSAVLAYDFSLSTLAYLDVPYRSFPSSSPTSTPSPRPSDDAGSAKSSSPPSPSSSSDNFIQPKHALRRLIDGDDDFHPDFDGDLTSYFESLEQRSTTHPSAVSATADSPQYDPFNPFDRRAFSSLSPVSTPSGDNNSIVSRNKALKERERRWEELDPKVSVRRTVTGPAGVYELQEGIFLLCDNYMGPAMTGSLKPMSIRLFKLPNADSTPPDYNWRDDPQVTSFLRRTISGSSGSTFGDEAFPRGISAIGERKSMPFETHTLDFSIADLTMDPTQDLIVVSEYNPAPISKDHIAPPHRFHLLSMSTFKPHPLASLATLDFPPFAQTFGLTRQLLQVMGDTLVVMVSRYAALWLGNVIPHIPGMESEEEIVVWNWKTGNVLSRMALPENGWFSSLAVLTPTTFMITSTSSISPLMSATSLETRSVAAVFPPVIQVYSFLSDPKNSSIPPQPFTSEHTDDSTPRPVLLAQLEMPRFADRIVISSFDVRPDPAYPPRPADDQTRPYGGTSPKNFTQDPSKGVLVFDLDVMEAPSETNIAPRRWPHKAYELFVLRETLIEYATRGEERLRRSWKDAVINGWSNHRIEEMIPWTEWGVQHSRLVDISMKRRAWVCSCSGYRFASLVRNVFSAKSSDDIDNEDDDDEDPFPADRLPHIADIRILDFSPFSVRKEISRRSAILQFGEYRYIMPGGSDFYSSLAVNGHYDDAGFGIRITENTQGQGPTYDIWRNIRDRVWKRVVTESTTLPKRRIFQENVETRLPYVDTVRMEGVWSNGIMMDDQRIMIISELPEPHAYTEQKMKILCM